MGAYKVLKCQFMCGNVDIWLTNVYTGNLDRRSATLQYGLTVV